MKVLHVSKWILTNISDWPDVLSERWLSSAGPQVLNSSKSKALGQMAMKTTYFGVVAFSG